MHFENPANTDSTNGRLILSIGQYDQSNNAISPFQYSASIGSDTLKRRKVIINLENFRTPKVQFAIYIY